MNSLFEQGLTFFNRLQTLEFYPYHLAVLFSPGKWQLLCCFLACSIVMIICLNAIEKNGFEGTLIGTLIMPYFSGFPNLCFAWLMSRKGSDGTVVLENCLVNNTTTLTIILAIPSIFWGLNLFKARQVDYNDMRVNRLSILLSLMALIFFGAAVYTVSRDGNINRSDGFILVGIFLFWQIIHIFDVLKNKTRKQIKIKKRIWFDLAVITLSAWGIFSSIDNLIELISTRNTGLFSTSHLGLLSGILMVMPNALLAIYYSVINRSDIAYSSQIGDCHICIPLCIGLYAIFSTITIYPGFQTSIYILITAAATHLLFITISGRLPRMAGLFLAGLYAILLYKGGY